MITIKKISKSEIPKLVAIAYEGDQELFDKYHSGNLFDDFNRDFPSAVLTTLDIIDEATDHVELSYYKVIYQKKPIGYFITFGNFLYSFAIAKSYRKRDVLIGWFESVKKVLGKNFFAILYDINTRAIAHLEKQGMQIIDHNQETRFVTLQN